MNEIQWYYAHDDQRFGPVSTVELKRLAERGQLAPADLVWREGMADWAEAGQIKGLFHDAPAAAPAAPAQPSGPPQVEPAAPAPRAPTARRALRHPVEMLLAVAHRTASEAFVDSSIRLFLLVGHYALYLAMLLLLAAGAAASAHSKSAAPILVAVATIPMLAVLQYAATQFCKALNRLNHSTRATVASTTLIDLIGIVSMVLGLFLLVALTAMVLVQSNYPDVLWAVLAFIICEHLAAVSFVHVDRNVIRSDELSPGEEALGTLCALLKAFARVVPVAFGAGVCCGTILLLVATVVCLGAEDLTAFWFATMPAATVVAFAALPMLGYLLFLLLALLFDILDGLLTLRQPRGE